MDSWKNAQTRWNYSSTSNCQYVSFYLFVTLFCYFLTKYNGKIVVRVQKYFDFKHCGHDKLLNINQSKSTYPWRTSHSTKWWWPTSKWRRTSAPEAMRRGSSKATSETSISVKATIPVMKVFSWRSIMAAKHK